MSAADVAIAWALSQRGKPYATVPDGVNTFDCSLLVKKAYEQAGVQLPRTTYQQILVGSPVSKADLQPGDLVFPSIEHVQLYIGNGNIVEAAHPGTTVRSVPMWGYWAGRRVAAPGNVVNPGSNGGNAPTGGVIPISDPTGIKTALQNGLTLAGWALMVAGGAALMVVGTIVALADTQLGGAAVQAASRGLVGGKGGGKAAASKSASTPPASKASKSKSDDQAPDEDEGYQPRHARGAGRRRRYQVTDEASGETVFAYGRADANRRREQARAAGRRVRVERA